MAGLCAAILAAYWNALGNGFVLDDSAQIQVNRRIRTLSGLAEYWRGTPAFNTAYRNTVKQAFYRPLFWASLGLDHLIWGTASFGYHLTNLILHMANACLLYRLLTILFSRPLATFAITLLWALPSDPDGVDRLPLRPRDCRGDPFSAHRPPRLATCKPHRARLDRLPRPGPLKLLACAALPRDRGHLPAPASLDRLVSEAFAHPIRPSVPGRIRWLEAILLLAPLVAYLALRLMTASFGKNVTGEWPLAGLGSRLALVLLTLSMYLRLLLFPVWLSADWSGSIHPPTTLGDLSFWLAMGLLGVMVWVALRLRTLSRTAWFGVGWLVLTLLPVSNVVPLYSVLAERYLYLSSIGFCIALVMAAVTAADRLRGTVPTVTSRPALAALAALLALLYGARTALRNRDYRDDLTLFSATVATTPESFLFRYMLGTFYLEKGQYDQARKLFTEAIRRKPDLAPAYGSLGELYEAIGRDDLALGGAYRKAVQLQPTIWLGPFKLGLLIPTPWGG